MAKDARSALVEQAKLAERSERYDDMAKFMEEMTKEYSDTFHTEERNLLSVAFKNVVGSRRSSWRIISSLQQKEEFAPKKKVVTDYLAIVEAELKEICNRVLVSL